MVNELVKYNNRLNSIPLRRFNSREMNLFFAIASRVANKGTDTVKFTFNQLKSLSNYTDHGDRFVEDLRKTYSKLISLSATSDDGDEIISFVAFTEYSIKRSTQTVSIAVNPKFQGLFNELSHWTRFNLSQFAELKSTYSKTMFRLLKQWRTVGKRTFSMEEFRYLLDIPKSYKVNDIDKRILKPIKRELTPMFKGLSIKKQRNSNKRGGKISGYTFTWKAETNNEDDFLKDSWYEIRKRITNIESNNDLTRQEKEDAKKNIYNNYSKKAIKQKESLPVENEKPQISDEERSRLRREIDERLKALEMNNDNGPME